MLVFTRKNRKIIKIYFNKRNSLRNLASSIEQMQGVKSAKLLRRYVFSRYKFEFISRNQERCKDIFSKEMLEGGVKSYILL